MKKSIVIIFSFFITFLSCKTNKEVKFFADLNAEIIVKSGNNRKVILKENTTKVIFKDSFNIAICRVNENFNNYSLDTVHDFFNNSKNIKYKQLHRNHFEILLDSTLYQFKIHKNNTHLHKEIYSNFFKNIVLLNRKDFKPDYTKINAFFGNNKLLFFDTFLNKINIKSLSPFKNLNEINFLIDRLNEEGNYIESSKIINQLYPFKAKKLKNGKSINDFKPININDEIEKLNEYQIILINDYHFFETSRYSTLFFLHHLKELGFLNLLTEGISPKTENKALKIKEIDGYYLKQPTYGLLIDYAVKNNINIFGYDYYYDCENKSLNNQKCRDSMQAVNIKSIVEKNPNSKFIVFGGHGHTFYNYEDIKPMGQYLKEILPNMKIVSLNQLYYIDSFGEQESIFKLLNNKYKLDTPHLIKEENTYFDYTIIQSDKEIGYWYKAKTEILPQKIKINKNKGYYVEVISKLTNITVFKGKIEQIKNNQIYLPEGKYKIIYYDTNYNLLN